MLSASELRALRETLRIGQSVMKALQRQARTASQIAASLEPQLAQLERDLQTHSLKEAQRDHTSEQGEHRQFSAVA